MKILIDTQCWLWMNASPDRFSEKTLGLLSDPANERWLSVASVWEITIKHALGKLPLPVAPEDYVPARLATTQTIPLSITAAHALRAGRLPAHHHDPFDRMLIAQALVEGVAVLTADRQFDRYTAETIAP